MLEIFQVTAQYSNAVLVAILPHVSDFAKRLDLPVVQPVTVAHVRRFGCSPRSDHIGGRVVLTNGYEFSFDRGRVALYRSPHSYFSLQNPDRIPEFYGPVKINQKQAVQIAHEAIKKLGYTDTLLHADRAGEVTEPIKIGKNVVPRYRFRWLKPGESSNSSPGTSIDLEVDASTGQIQMMSLLNTNTWRPDPKVGVQPPVIGKGPQTTYRGGRKINPVSQAYSNAFLVALLPQLSDFAKKAGFEVKLPITTNDVDMRRYDCGLVEGDPSVFLYLKTGERFVYSSGQVISFEAADAVRLPENNQKPSKQFYGRVNMTTNEAVSLARRTVTQLGYSIKLLGLDKPPDVAAPRKEGTNIFARYFLNWRDAEWTQYLAVAEVDATTRKLKALYINDRANTNLWRAPPKVNVPATTETDASPK